MSSFLNSEIHSKYKERMAKHLDRKKSVDKRLDPEYKLVGGNTYPCSHAPCCHGCYFNSKEQKAFEDEIAHSIGPNKVSFTVLRAYLNDVGRYNLPDVRLRHFVHSPFYQVLVSYSNHDGTGESMMMEIRWSESLTASVRYKVLEEVHRSRTNSQKLIVKAMRQGSGLLLKGNLSRDNCSKTCEFPLVLTGVEREGMNRYSTYSPEPDIAGDASSHSSRSVNSAGSFHSRASHERGRSGYIPQTSPYYPEEASHDQVRNTARRSTEPLPQRPHISNRELQEYQAPRRPQEQPLIRREAPPRPVIQNERVINEPLRFPPTMGQRPSRTSSRAPSRSSRQLPPRPIGNQTVNTYQGLTNLGRQGSDAGSDRTNSTIQASGNVAGHLDAAMARDEAEEEATENSIIQADPYQNQWNWT
jgi:hypothetical protein